MTVVGKKAPSFSRHTYDAPFVCRGLGGAGLSSLATNVKQYCLQTRDDPSKGLYVLYTSLP